MATKDKVFAAVEVMHAALRPLTPDERRRALASVCAVLEVPPASQSVPSAASAAPSTPPRPPTQAASGRPLSIRELIQEKNAHSHPQLITLFAYYREKHQNQPTFSREALKQYYSSSREKPPANYDRDFVKAIERGWIHEDGENSYITSKGIEAIESGFADDRASSTHPARSKPSKRIRHR